MYLKSIWVAALSLFLTLGMVEQADAKRFGSGGFGKTFSTSPFKKSAPQKSQPAKQDQNKATDNQSGGAQQNLAGKSQAAGAAGKSGMMGGLFGGLLAGGLLAYMLGSGAFEGVQFMDILLLLLVAFIGFKIFKSMVQPKAAAAGPSPLQGRNTHSTSSDSMTHQAANAGSMFKQAVGNFSQQNGGAAAMELPQGFNQAAFMEGALEHYRTLQQAWNQGNLDVVREYVAPDLYAQLHNQRREMGVAPQTEVMDLQAELIRAERIDGQYNVSILFRGRCKDELEGSEDGIFDVWHLAKSESEGTWLIVGIEAE